MWRIQIRHKTQITYLFLCGKLDVQKSSNIFLVIQSSSIKCACTSNCTSINKLFYSHCTSAGVSHIQQTVNPQWFSLSRVTVNHASCCSSGQRRLERKKVHGQKKSARVFGGEFTGVKISSLGARMRFIYGDTRQAVAVTPTVHQRRHEPKTTLWPHMQHSSSAMWLLHHFTQIPLDYCLLLFHTFCLHNQLWLLRIKQPAGLQVSFSWPNYVSIIAFISYYILTCFFIYLFFFLMTVCAMFAACACCEQILFAHALTSSLSHWIDAKGQSSLTCQWWQGLMGSRSCCHNSFYHSIDCGEVRENMC